MNMRSIVPAAVVIASLAGGAIAGERAGAPDGSDDQRIRSALTDAWLDGKLETALLFNEHLNSFAIDTDVKNRVAYLSGSVESDIDRELAEAIARSVDGIEDVESDLTVDGDRSRAALTDRASEGARSFKQGVLNATLTARVKTHLLLNDHTRGMNINVDSRKGVVSLSGTVASDEERDLAVHIAKNTNGAVSVVDNLLTAPEEEAE